MWNIVKFITILSCLVSRERISALTKEKDKNRLPPDKVYFFSESKKYL